MFQILLSVALASSSPPLDWVVVDEEIDGTQFCILSRTYDDGTVVGFIVYDKFWSDGLFGFHASNSSWSISDGEVLGDITLITENYQFGAPAIGGDSHDFFFAVSLAALDPFLDSAKDGGFKMIRKGTRVIGNYGGGDLGSKMPEFQDCLDRHFDQPDDPFAD